LKFIITIHTQKGAQTPNLLTQENKLCELNKLKHFTEEAIP
jgi:hypothetical protein